jgi:Nucleotidyltransferase domain
MKGAEELYDDIYAASKMDPNVLGLLLLGSRGKGAATKYSDYDVLVVVKDGMAPGYRKKPPFNVGRDGFDLDVTDLSEFRKSDAFGGPREWNRYAYAHVKAQVDKTGEVQRLVNEKSKIPKDRVGPFVEGTLDGYINFVYRSLKCRRDGDTVGFRLEASREIPLFINILFAMDGRMSPYYKYLVWELTTHPIKQFPMPSEEILNALMEIINTGSPKAQQKLLRCAETAFRRRGYGSVFDNWKQLKWMETVKL